MTTSNDRILFIIKHFCDDNQAEFARRMSEKPQTISGWLKRSNGKRVLDKILNKFPMVNPAWLYTGTGEMLDNSSDARVRDAMAKEVDAYIPEPKKEKVIEIQAVPMNPNAILHVPLVNQYAYAGYLSGYQNETYMETLPTIPFIADHEGRGNYIAFEVRGDSMNDGSEESYLEGDRLLCREIPRYLWVDSKLHIKKWDFVIVHEDGIIVKRITDHDVENHTITVHSLNDMYPDRVLDLAEVKQIFNVIEMQRPKRR